MNFFYGFVAALPLCAVFFFVGRNNPRNISSPITDSLDNAVINAQRVWQEIFADLDNLLFYPPFADVVDQHADTASERYGDLTHVGQNLAQQLREMSAQYDDSLSSLQKLEFFSTSFKEVLQQYQTEIDLATACRMEDIPHIEESIRRYF